MAKLMYGLMQSLDGYVDDVAGTLALPGPGPALFQHFVGRMQSVAGSLYGRRIYELMRYWEVDNPEWDAPQRAFGAAWQATPKWVVSRTLETVGPNATLIRDDLAGAVRQLKAEVEGEIEVCGPTLAGSLTDLGLIDEYQLYFRPFVLGQGKPFFTGPMPPLRLVETQPIGEDAVRLSYCLA